MEVEQLKLDALPMTYDEASLEQSKNFITALQELKNLRPQLYSAAEYCEKSYLHSEQKQMVLDNLKDYALQALVNAVDHLGTVTYKLNGLVEQQATDIDTMNLRLICLNQQILTCQTYMDKEGLKQQRLLAIIPRHHKRYVLPNSINKKVHFSPSTQTDLSQIHVNARPRVHPSGTQQKTLSWHLAYETKPSRNWNHKSPMSYESQETPVKSTPVFQLLDNKDSFQAKSPTAASHLSSRNHTSKDSSMASKPMTPYRSFDNGSRQITRAPVRNKSMLSAFFVKQKGLKRHAGSVS
ncbi:hypothetical protein V2J09_002390 [Rumex salicifolius]